MKKTTYTLVSVLMALLGLTSCNDWLDLEPSDTTTETKLFETGEGYRIALNGVYAQMSESSLYGKEMTWGFMDVAAQMYLYYNLSSGYDDVAKDYSYNNKYVKPFFQAFWSKMYNSIANCNNIVQNISAEQGADKFVLGEDEKSLIHGEALALRAYLHFDLLRMFAPSMKADDGKAHLPYVKVYPTRMEEYVTNARFIELLIADLQEAKSLLEAYEIENAEYMSTLNRIEGSSAPVEDVFFYYRGFRMNYYAVCALLARVYNYAGMHQEAFNETEIVINASSNPEYGSSYYRCFQFDNSWAPTYYGNNKLYGEVVFACSNDNLIDLFEPHSLDNADNFLALNASSIEAWYDDDDADVRAKLLKVEGGNVLNTKYLEVSGDDAAHCDDLIPMIRLSEMYFIRAEYYYYQQDDLGKAIAELDEVRTGYGCTVGRLGTDFEQELINEARRAFVGEGQLFYYHKKMNKLPARMKSAEQFVFLLPDDESI